MKNLYIISGPNGAGKTTASFTFLPEIFECKEFVNADEIAKGLSPFNQDNASVQIQSGRLMLKRIHELLEKGESFALETTLSTRSYVKFIEKAKDLGYKVTLLFLYLESSKLAIQRVQTRVIEGGHNIPKKVIVRRYYNGLSNFFNLYMDKVDYWAFIDNSYGSIKIVAEQSSQCLKVTQKKLWLELKKKHYAGR